MKKIQDYLDQSVLDDVFCGCVAAIIYQNHTNIYVSGLREKEPQNVINTKESLYDMASLTKVMATSMVALRMMKEGLLTLNDKVIDYIKEFKYPEVTIFHIMSHTSGLPADHYWFEKTSKEKVISDICEMELIARPGQKVIYSDMGYILFGYLLEQIGHDTLDHLVEKYVLKPLDMQHTCFNPKKELCAPTEYDASLDAIVKGFVHDEKGRTLHGVAGHAGLFSNIEDTIKYAKMLLKNDDSFIERKYIQMMYQNLTPENEINRGLIFLSKDENSPFPEAASNMSFMHTGFTGTSIYLDLQYDLAIIVLSNRVHPTRNNTKILPWRKEFHEFVYKTLKVA